MLNFFSADTPCSLHACKWYLDKWPVEVHAEDILQTVKLFATHCVVDKQLYNKGKFYYPDCSAFGLANIANIVLQGCYRLGSGRTFEHLITQDGFNIIRSVYYYDFDEWTGYFYYQGRIYHQRAVVLVYEFNRLLSMYPAGDGYPEGGRPANTIPLLQPMKRLLLL